MSVTILVCECGQRMRAPGATPGRGGRCPKCGAMVRVPESAPPAEAASGTGYGVGDDWAKPAGASAVAPSVASDPVERRKPSTRDRPPAPSFSPQAWWPPKLLYPLRGGDSLGVVAVTGVVFWIFATLIPEYCLTLMADGAKLGASAMGALIALISILPSVAVVPMVLFYMLQYLGRVLVASAEGDARPPRPPDRNFEGLLQGLSPWFVWLLLGVALPLSPLPVLALVRGGSEALPPALVAVILLVGLPYALMALMMTFLHDHALAASPPAVLGAIARLGPSYWGVCLAFTTVVGLGLGGFGLILNGRAGFYWLYIAASLLGWAFLVWTLIVAMQMLGTFYHRRRKVLKWRVKTLRWGVSWRA